MPHRAYQQCTRCVMDTTDEDITFNEDGVCNHCLRYDQMNPTQVTLGQKGQDELKKIIQQIKQERKNYEYDCILGLSGGVDSSYAAYLAKELGLRILAVHVDSGWNSELAIHNIENIVKKLDLDLYTYVCDWNEMRDLQLSFFKASVANCDIPQDHAFIAAIYKVAKEKNIPYTISGQNFSTESILPISWGHTNMDTIHIKAIQQQFGTQKLKKYPMVNFFGAYYYYPCIFGLTSVKVLDFMDYNKEQAKKFLKEHLDWRDYGGKHYESKFTKFFQAYYLPEKFGYDKRKAHLSSLIVSNQITKEQALQELEKPLYDPKELQADIEYIVKKLGITLEEWNTIMALPKKTYLDYPSNKWLYENIKKRFDKYIPCTSRLKRN